MKLISVNIILIVILNSGLGNVRAQVMPPVSNQNIIHPTISDLRVSYKGAPDNNPGVNAIPQALVILSDTSINKIYFKLINPQTGAIVYDINYLLNASTVINDQGITLYQYSNGSVSISNGQSISLRPYLYQIQTENQAHVLSPVYTTIK